MVMVEVIAVSMVVMVMGMVKECEGNSCVSGGGDSAL